MYFCVLFFCKLYFCVLYYAFFVCVFNSHFRNFLLCVYERGKGSVHLSFLAAKMKSERNLWRKYWYPLYMSFELIANAIKNQECWSMIHSLSSKTFVIPAVWWMYSLGGEDQSPIKLSPALYLPPPTTKGQSESLKARSSSWVQSLKVPKMASTPLKIKTDEFLCTLETLHPVRE